MNKEVFKIFKEDLIKNKKYKEYVQHLHYEDYILCKEFHKEDNKFEEGRSSYLLILYIYDSLYKDKVGINIRVSVSRTTEELINLELPFILEHESIEEIEGKAEEFYQWIIQKWPVPYGIGQ